MEPPVSWAPPPDFSPPAPRGPIDSAPLRPVPPRPGPVFAPPAPRHPGQAGFEPFASPAADTRKGEKRRWVVGATLGLVVVLAGVLAYQAVRIEQLGDRLATNERVQADERAQAAGRLDGLDGRATDLEKRLGAAFNPEAISSAALPSVFRVAAGNVTGTAFAVGKPASGGKTNMITNFHVVEDVYEAGGRQVFLERDSKRYAATIVDVDKSADVAHLRTSTKINGLVTAKGAVKSGQQIVVVGAPLGLSDSVTTGVVSAVRELPESDGPMIQFDAPINPGNSGGPVINSAKQVVGIATAKAQDAEGIGLAVPIKVACDAFKIC
ncbi:trypsin-like peptidase domain-containing protein [Asanoa sp. NPDC049518]|uniref:S1C family serine protease n=1 Tax=unclassified Asanoa TaxID=2685164 RepID=UPI0034360310